MYYYDPQPAGINLQSPQRDSTPWTLILPQALQMEEDQDDFITKFQDLTSNFSQNDSTLPMVNGKYFDLEFFIKTGDAGFYQIAINICSNLGLKDMKMMREVNKTIKRFMDEERMFAKLLTKPIFEVLSVHDSEEFDQWIEFISVVKKEGTLPELFSLIPINRKYVCIEHVHSG